MICCAYCNAEVGSPMAQAYHSAEARRILADLDGLGTEFAEDGIVRTVLADRAQQETERGRKRNDS